MIQGSPFFFNTIYNTVAAFGRLFADYKIYRTDSNGQIIQTIKVPLAYGPKRHWYTQLQQKSDLGPQGNAVSIILPRMSFEMASLNMDPTRQLSKINSVRAKDPEFGALLRQLQPVPYQMSIDLNIFSKNQADGFRIVEQILPYFSPQLNLTLRDIPQLGIERDVAIILDSVTNDNEYEGEFTDRQLVSWTLSFNILTHFYPAVTDAKLIKKAMVHIYGDKAMTNLTETITTEVDPETANKDDVDSNGNPTYQITTSVDIEGL